MHRKRPLALFLLVFFAGVPGSAWTAAAEDELPGTAEPLLFMMKPRNTLSGSKSKTADSASNLSRPASAR